MCSMEWEQHSQPWHETVDSSWPKPRKIGLYGSSHSRSWRRSQQSFGRGTEGSVKLHQNPKNFARERVFPLLLGLKKEWECLKAWPDPTTGFGSSILAGTEHPASFPGSAWCWISAPGPRWGSCSQNSSPQPSQQLWNWFLSRIWGTSQGQGSRRGHMGLGTPGCHTQRDQGGMGGVEGRGKERIARNFGWTHP